MDTSNILRYNGYSPFDNWCVRGEVINGYYPRNSLINLLSNNVTIKDGSIIIPEGVVTIGCSCFRNNNYQSIVIPPSVRKINKNAFLNCGATLLIHNNEYVLRYAIRHKLNYQIITEK